MSPKRERPRPVAGAEGRGEATEGVARMVLDPGAAGEPRPLLDRQAVGRRYQVCVRKVGMLRSTDALPAPVMIGRHPRWCPDKLSAWERAGAPTGAALEAFERQWRGVR